MRLFAGRPWSAGSLVRGFCVHSRSLMVAVVESRGLAQLIRRAMCQTASPVSFASGYLLLDSYRPPPPNSVKMWGKCAHFSLRKGTWLSDRYRIERSGNILFSSRRCLFDYNWPGVMLDVSLVFSFSSFHCFFNVSFFAHSASAHSLALDKYVRTS